MKRKLALAILLAACPSLWATNNTTRFVNNSCSNNGDGTSAACASSPGGVGAWNSFANVNSNWCGQDSFLKISGPYAYRETYTIPCSGATGHPTTVTSYDNGPAPVIKGSNVITGWAAANGGGTCDGVTGFCWSVTYAHTMTSSTGYLFQDDNRLVWGTSATALTNHQYFWTSNTLTMRNDAGNPDSLSYLMEATNRNNCLLAATQSYVTVNNIACWHSESYGIRHSASSTGTVWNKVVTHNLFQPGQLPTASSSTITNSVLDGYNNGLNGDGFTISNSILVGAKQLSTGTATTSCNNCLWDAYIQLPVLYTTAGTINILNSNITGSATGVAKEAVSNTAGTTNLNHVALVRDSRWPGLFVGAGTTTETADQYRPSMFTRAPRQGVLVFAVDDLGDKGVWDGNNAILNPFGIYTSIALNDTQDVTTPTWAALQTSVDAGNDVISHTRSHPDLRNTNGAHIRYVGAGSAASLAVTATNLTTIVIGESSSNLNILLSDYSTLNHAEAAMCTFIIAFNGGGKYTCTEDTPDNFNVPQTLLNAQTAADIKSSAYTLTYNATAFYAYELAGSMADINAHLNCNSAPAVGNCHAGPGAYDERYLAYPAGNYNAAVVTAVAANGYYGARAGPGQWINNWVTSFPGLNAFTVDGVGDIVISNVQFQIEFVSNCNDTSTVGNNFTCTNVTFGSGVYPPSRNNSGLFNGTSSYAQSAVISGTWSNWARGDFTMGGWINPTALSGVSTIYKQATDANNYTKIYVTSDGSIVLSIVAAGVETLHLASAAGVIQTATWTEFTVEAWNGFYQIIAGPSGAAGGVVASMNSTVRPANYTGKIYLGASDGTSDFWNGYMAYIGMSREGYSTTLGTLNSLAANGAIGVAYGHGMMDYFMRPVGSAIAAWRGNAITMTFSQAMNWLRALGTVQSDNQTWIYKQANNPDYRPRMGSPLCGAGTTTLGNKDMDGLPYLTSDIGPYRCTPKSAFVGMM